MSKNSFEYNAKSLFRNIGSPGCTHATSNHPTKGASDQNEQREEVLQVGFYGRIVVHRTGPSWITTHDDGGAMYASGFT